MAAGGCTTRAELMRPYAHPFFRNHWLRFRGARYISLNDIGPLVLLKIMLRKLRQSAFLLGAVLAACGGGGGSPNASALTCTPIQVSHPISGALRITTQTCPATTQGSAYTGCTLAAAGGTPPYIFSIGSSQNYPSLPEGMSLNACSGAISANIVGGQGYYQPQFIVTDSTGAQATTQVAFSIAGNNAYLSKIFPSTSIFHHPVAGLPVDLSPAAPIPAAYASVPLKVFFGNTSGAPFPNGIPVIEVPATQPNVPVTTTLYQSYFTTGPIPPYAPVEGTANSNGDRHVLVYRQAGNGQTPALYEMWQGIYNSANSSWTDSSNALWPDTDSNALTPQDQGTSDAAGLPIAPLLLNADEVIGSGTPTNPNGIVTHPIRFTLNHMLNYWVWPATSTAGIGTCTGTGGALLTVRQRLSQSSPPANCTSSGPAGEIYRLNTSDPACAATSPQAKIIMTAMRNYGIILADNGISGALIGTPDSRWDDADLACLGQLKLSDFVPVNVSSLMVSADSGQTAP